MAWRHDHLHREAKRIEGRQSAIRRMPACFFNVVSPPERECHHSCPSIHRMSPARDTIAAFHYQRRQAHENAMPRCSFHPRASDVRARRRYIQQRRQQPVTAGDQKEGSDTASPVRAWHARQRTSLASRENQRKRQPKSLQNIRRPTACQNQHHADAEPYANPG